MPTQIKSGRAIWQSRAVTATTTALAFLIVLAVGIWAYVYELSLPALGFHWTSVGIVYSVVPGGAADSAGVQVGDRFWLDGERVEEADAFNRVLHRIRVGQTVEVEVERNGEVVALPLTPMPNTLFLEGWLVDYLVGLACWLSGWLIYRMLSPQPGWRAYQVFALDMALLFFTLRPSPVLFRVIEYVCFGLAPGLFLWFFLEWIEDRAARRWVWVSVGGLPGLLSGLANAALVFLHSKPAFNWPYLVMGGSLVWGMLVWLAWLFVRLRSAPQVSASFRRLQESAFKIIILTAPWLVLMVYGLATTSRRGTTMLLHFSTVGFPLALTFILLESSHRSVLDRLTRQAMVQLPLQAINQAIWGLLFVLARFVFRVNLSWSDLVLVSFIICLFTLFTPWLSGRLSQWAGLQAVTRGENRGHTE